LLLAQVAEAGERLLDAADRRIARLGFDIHDGPLQRLSLLAGDLASLDRTLGRISPGDETFSLARQRVGEIAFTLGEAQRELRDLTLSAANSGTGLLADDLGREVVRFGNRTGVRVRLKIAGDIERTTRSQRLAVHRVVEESLANIREHAQATTVDISLRRLEGRLRLTIRDNGRGFDVGRALRRASRDGRLGLVAMAERVRFLGGELEISSRPGGSTTVSATLPAWELPVA
jgi:signal transduction histidine kinase